MEENNEQIVYINMDDSGRLVKGEPNELVFVYGGGILSFLKRTRKFFKAI